MTCAPSTSEGPRRKELKVSRKVFNNKMISLGIGATALALALAGDVAQAQNQGGVGRFARGIRAAMATLDLSDAQKEKVKAIFTSHREQFLACRTQARANREALKAAASAEDPDPGGGRRRVLEGAGRREGR